MKQKSVDKAFFKKKKVGLILIAVLWWRRTVTQEQIPKGGRKQLCIPAAHKQTSNEPPDLLCSLHLQCQPGPRWHSSLISSKMIFCVQQELTPGYRQV